MDVNDTYLLFGERERLIIPVCDSTFNVSQSSLSNLKKSYIGCKIIKRNGEVKQILSIKKLGLWGEDAGRKLLSALTGAFYIDVEFKSLGKISLADFKIMLNEYLIKDDSTGDPFLPQSLPIEEVCGRVNAATSIDMIFQVIDMPSVEDCLDVL